MVQRTLIFTVWAFCLSLVGCMDALQKDTEAKGSIFNQKTQDIGEFNPNAKQEVSDNAVKADNPVLAPLQAYGPAMSQIADIAITSAVNTFYALEGRYPKNHAEFMDRVVRENGIQLPVLPAGWRYTYDVPNHKLVIVRDVVPETGNKGTGTGSATINSGTQAPQ